MIALLGNTNDEMGNLSPVAISRCNKAIELWNLDKNQEIVTTGTFGSHFNTTAVSHSDYLKHYLLSNGVIPEKILPNIISTNTFQDILGLRELLLKRKDLEVTIVTSDFHFDRVQFHCLTIIQDLLPYKLINTPSPLPAEEKEKLVEYEKQRLTAIRKFPEEIYENASAEQKHYDNVSIAMITGLLTAFVIGYKFIIDVFKEQAGLLWWEKLLYFVVPLTIVITLFWKLYLRAAETARTARKTLRNIERCYSQFGFSLFYSTYNLKNHFFTFQRILHCLYLFMPVLLLKQINAYFSAGLTLIIVSYLLVKYSYHLRNIRNNL